LAAVEFLKNFNTALLSAHPGAITVAEESTAWPQVTRPPYLGGLGFCFKWNMGWMHDTLTYFSRDPIYRKYHQNDLTFATLYQYTENFILPFSHDEVVHGKGSLAAKMPGDDWQKFANLRAMLAYQWLFPGKKLLMMGSELGQTSEWNANASIDWALLEQGPYHRGLQQLVRDLNQLYQKHPALFDADYDPAGFFWIDCADAEHSVLSFIRQTREGGVRLAVILNLTPELRAGYRVGLPQGGSWREVMNTDAQIYGGSNQGNLGGVIAEAQPLHHQPFSAAVTLPPLSVIALCASD
jgi:1,4-alpha-glucan branching enzyme